MNHVDLPKIGQILNRICIYIPHILIILSLLVWIYFGISGQTNLFQKSPIYFIPIVGTSIFLIFKKKLDISGNSYPLCINQRLLRKITVIIFAIEVITLLTLGYQSPLFLFLVIISFCLILLQLLSEKPNFKIIIIDLMIALSLLILPQLFSPTVYYGDTDLLTHYERAESIINLGYVDSNIFGSYGTYNLYHILIAVSSIITSIIPRLSLYLVSTVAVIISLPFVYKLAKYFTKSEKISLIALFVYSVIPMILHSLLVPAPRVMATMACFIVLYLFFVLYNNHKVVTSILLIITLLYMSLIHHAQLLFIIAIFILLLLGGFIYNPKETINRWKQILLIILIPLLSLCYGYLPNIQNIIDSRLLAGLNNGGLQTTRTDTPTDIPEVSEAVNTFSGSLFDSIVQCCEYVFLIVFILIGIYAIIKRYKDWKHCLILLPLCLLAFVFFIPGVADQFPFITNALQVYRLRYILALFFAIVTAIGCTVVLNLGTSKKGKKMSLLVVILILGVLVGVNIYNSGFDDNDLRDFDKRSAERYFTTEEITALAAVQQLLPQNSRMYSDRSVFHYIRRMVNTPYHCDPAILNINLDYEDMLDSHSYVFLPVNKYRENKIKIAMGKVYNEVAYYPLSSNLKTDTMLKEFLYTHDKAYNTGGCVIYHTRI